MRLRNSTCYQIQTPWGEVAKIVGLSRKQVYFYRNLAVRLGKIQTNEYGHEIISDEIKQRKEFLFLDKNDFFQHSFVNDWTTDLLTRKQGQPLKTWKNRVTQLRKICSTCRINPEQLLVDKKTTEKIMKNYAHLCNIGEVCIGKSSKNSEIINTIHCAVMAVRSFCAYHGITWPNGISGIMSGKVIGHGKYSDIKLTTKELEIADKFIQQKWGIDSDIYRIFWVGIESCARKTALLNMKCQWTKHVNELTGKSIFIMTVYESKTSHIKDGKWIKYITNQTVQKSLEHHKSKNFTRIWIPFGKNKSTQAQLRNQLREIYQFVGKLDDYYYSNPFHSLRHIGAHYWLGKTNYNYGFVAKIGGWHVIDELKNSYGEMPPEFIIKTLEMKIN